MYPSNHWLRIFFLSVTCLMFAFSACVKKQTPSKEHPGKEHPGEEHPGKEHPGKEHPGKEHPGEEHEHPGEEKKEHPGSTAHNFTAADIKTAMMAHIKAHTKETNGTFVIRDEKTNEKLKLEFVKIHDPVRKIDGKGYFACTDFHPVGTEATKLYDLDFWLNPEDGQLKVTKTSIHKHPKLKASNWVKQARYTFVDDEPVEVE